MSGRERVEVTFIPDPTTSSFSDQLKADVERARSLDVSVGFLSSEGLEFLVGLLGRRRDLVYRVVVGHAKLEVLRKLQEVIRSGRLSGGRIRLHLGLVRTQASKRIHEKPMMHAKLFYLEMDDGYDILYVGSYNLTKAALHDENYEAGVRIRANRDSDFMVRARSYINRIWSEAVAYNPDKAELYAWMFNLGVKDLIDQRIAEKIYEKLGIQHSPTIILAALDPDRIPLSEGDIIDVDVRSPRLKAGERRGKELHVYLVDSAADLSPILQNVVQRAYRLLVCRITGDVSTSRSRLSGSAAKPSKRYRAAIRYARDEKTFRLIAPELIKDEELGIKGERQLHAVIMKVITNREEMSRYRYLCQEPLEDLVETELGRIVKPGLASVKDLRIRSPATVKESVGYRDRRDSRELRASSYIWTSEYVSFKDSGEDGEGRVSDSIQKSLTEYLRKRTPNRA